MIKALQTVAKVNDKNLNKMNKQELDDLWNELEKARLAILQEIEIIKTDKDLYLVQKDGV